MLENISIANGYDTDVAKVALWKQSVFTADAQPGINIRPQLADKNTEVQGANYIWDIIQNVEIDAIAGDYTSAVNLKFDIMRCIGADVTIGGYVYKIDYLQDTKIVDSLENQRLIGITLHLDFYYRLSAWGGANVYFDESGLPYEDASGVYYIDGEAA